MSVSETHRQVVELIGQARKELEKSRRPKPASTAIALIGNGFAVWAWWAVMHGGVPNWVAWTYFGLCAAAGAVNLLKLLKYLADE